MPLPALAIPALKVAGPIIASGLGKLFGGLFNGPNPEKTYKKALDKYLKTGYFDPSSGFGKLMLQQQREEAQRTLEQGRSNKLTDEASGYYSKLIPQSFSQLSAPVGAQRDMELDAAAGAADSARVGGLGQLNQKFGGRVPASVYSGFLGSLARGESQDRTNIARNASVRNVALGSEGAAGLAGLRGTQTAPATFSSIAGLPTAAGATAQQDAQMSPGQAAVGAGVGAIGPLIEWLMNRKKLAAPYNNQPIATFGGGF